MYDVLVGRAAELEEVTAALRGHRLVTIVGAPGVGKTRLAAEAVGALGKDFDDVVDVELSAGSADDDMARAVAAALGVSNSAGGTAIESAASLVGERRVLLSLDNCEHVLGPVVAVVETLLDRCPNLRILATSRQALATEGEFVVTLAPLASPDSVALFVARAHKGFILDESNEEAVTEICRRLDGLPLAIELAAARTDVLAPHQLAEMIDQRFSTVMADPIPADPKHRTVGTAIEWSWDLLTPSAQALLRRLSAFVGGATASAVRKVCNGTELPTDEVQRELRRLVDHSLAVSSNDRYYLLQTVRHFATQQLVHAGEETEAYNRHAIWAIALAEQAEPQLTGSNQREWIARLNSEKDNLRAALQWLTTNHRPEPALRLASALTLWWRATSALTEGRRWFRDSINLASDSSDKIPSILWGNALFGAALLADVQGDIATAFSNATEAFHIAYEISDARLSGRATLTLGSCIRRYGPRPDATKALEECVAFARQADDSWCLAYGLAMLSGAAGVREPCDEAVAVARGSGDSIALAYALTTMVDRVSDIAVSEELLREAVAVTTGLSCPERGTATMYLGQVAVRKRDWQSAERFLDLACRDAWRADSMVAVATSQYELATLAHARGDLVRARDLLQRTLAIEDQVGIATVSVELRMARVMAEQGDFTVATELTKKVEHEARLLGRSGDVVRALMIRADLSRRRSDLTTAYSALMEAILLADSKNDVGQLADCLDDLGGLTVASELFAEGVTFLAAAQSLRADQGSSRFLPDHPYYVGDLEAARSSLSGEEFERAWAIGADLGVQDAVRLAVGVARPPVVPIENPWAQLSDKEWAVVELVAQGLTDREVSARLMISERTANNRLYQARIKLGSLTRSGLVNEVLHRIQPT
ncbi:MAG: LuxR C-terminal-related transcriptional regulator [Actinomycetota bacterium]|nr:LuxR C-terminal-related transcriptional regulator [Actinomycetota bacterium]